MNGSVYHNTRDLIAYLWRESDLRRSPATIFVIAASASRTGLIWAINETAARGGASLGMILLLIGLVVFMLWTVHHARMSGQKLVQDMMAKQRRRMKDELLAANTTFFQSRDQGQVFAAVREHVYEVAQTTMRIVDVMQAVVLLFFCLIYLAFQSWISIGGALIAATVGVAVFTLTEIPARRALARSHQAHVTLHDKLSDLLRGYKELRLRRARRNDLSMRLEQIIDDTRRVRMEYERYFSLGQLGGTGALAALLISIVAILPLTSITDPVTILQIITLMLFCFGPIETMVGGLPGFVRASVSLRIIRDVEAGLAENHEAQPDLDAIDHRAGFTSVELRGVSVTLTREVPSSDGKAVDSFTLGPLDLTLYPGQSVFITGGNGMGKSTLLQLLTGLRYPDTGEILIDGERVTRENISAYRSVFAAVFSEFYMFRELYGLGAEDRARLQHNIEELGLAEGVTIAGDGFATLALSTGQMRRLALAIALAEQRPILVLDEFAADQDPARRHYFYEELVPRLARAGHCVVAVTHDEHCFEKCDRLIRMEDGKIVSDTVLRETPAEPDLSETA